MHYHAGPHSDKIDFENLQWEKGDWDKNEAYGLSKLLVIMFTRAFKYKDMLQDGTTLINMNPGVFETKMILAGWPLVGPEVEEAVGTFKLATEETWSNPNREPIYYDELVEQPPLIPPALDPVECGKVYDHLCKLIKEREEYVIPPWVDE